MKRIWILAGEASGDLYGAALAKELRLLAARDGETLELSGMGGPRMKEAEIPLEVDSTELGVVGFIEILRHIFTFIRIYFHLVFQARRVHPDAVVLIDYPGFNLLFALAMFFSRIQVVWYVCPQLWAWGKWRRPVLARICTRMLVIFPFEVDVFAGTPIQAEFVGHPLYDMVMARKDPSIVRDMDMLLLLPGSRRMEVDRLLVPMLETVLALHKRNPKLRYHMALPREKIRLRCNELLKNFRRRHPELPDVTVSVGDTGIWLQKASAGLSASGTVTVECALAGLPLVVGYKLNYVTLFLASLVIKLYRGFFTMTNIIAYRTVYKEFLQWRFAPNRLVPAIEEILPGGSRREEVEKGMADVREALRPGAGSAAAQAAVSVWDCANHINSKNSTNKR